MRPSQAVIEHRAEIRRIVLAHGVKNPRLFGSVARGGDMEGSDLDLLVDPTSETSLFDLGAIKYQLTHLLGFSVDVLTPNALPENFRAKVLAEAIAL